MVPKQRHDMVQRLQGTAHPPPQQHSTQQSLLLRQQMWPCSIMNHRATHSTAQCSFGSPSQTNTDILTPSVDAAPHPLSWTQMPRLSRGIPTPIQLQHQQTLIPVCATPTPHTSCIYCNTHSASYAHTALLQITAGCAAHAVPSGAAAPVWCIAAVKSCVASPGVSSSGFMPSSTCCMPAR